MASNSNSFNAIVWEFESDIPGLFTPYEDKVSNYIEDEYSKSPLNQNFSLATADQLLADYEVDLTSMIQSNLQGKARKIRRRLHDVRTTAIGSGISWQWMTDKGWINYNTEATEAIEKCFTQGLDQCDLEPLGFGIPIIVLITKGYQKNKNSGFFRPAQRKSVSFKTDAPPTAAVKKGNTSDKDRNGTKLRTDSKAENVLSQFSSVCKNVAADEDCAICLSSLKEEQQQSASSIVEEVLELKICKHKYHESCLEALFKQTHHGKNCLKCPICKQIHGILCGNQPPGKMTHQIFPDQSVAGYEGDGMIVITYDIQSGIQGPTHPNPGQKYIANGFPRIGYLPGNKKGKMILKLLEIAFERKLTFTIGISSTTGHNNMVTWTNIHHKTSPKDRGTGHGYPDPSYLDNVIDELRENGVTEQNIS